LLEPGSCAYALPEKSCRNAGVHCSKQALPPPRLSSSWLSHLPEASDASCQNHWQMSTTIHFLSCSTTYRLLPMHLLF
jgi:hypothetical protein